MRPRRTTRDIHKHRGSTGSDPLNAVIIRQFELLLRQIGHDINFSTGTEQVKHAHRHKSVQRVLDIIRAFPTEITTASQLEGIEGVGSHTIARVSEILKTGRLREIELTSNAETLMRVIEDLEEVFGVGRKRAYELVKKHGIQSIEELRDKNASGEIQLSPMVVRALSYVGKIKEHIPHEEITQFVDVIRYYVTEIDARLFATFCGSYRRLSPTSNDIDIVLTHTKLRTKSQTHDATYLNQLVVALREDEVIIESLTSDDVQTKYMGICQTVDDGPLRRIDIRFVPYESYPSAILYFTGSRDFNRKMRMVANSMNYTLNEYGLFDENDQMIRISEERDIFEALGMEYLSPELRNN